MDLANDERIRKLNNQTQLKQTQQRFMMLVKELTRLLDELQGPKSTLQDEGPPSSADGLASDALSSD